MSFSVPDYFFLSPVDMFLPFQPLLTFLREEKPEEEEFILLTTYLPLKIGGVQWCSYRAPISHDYVKSITKIGRQIHRMEKSQSAGMPRFHFGYMVSAILNTRVSPQARKRDAGVRSKREKSTVADHTTAGWRLHTCTIVMPLVQTCYERLWKLSKWALVAAVRGYPAN